ncbi:DUF3566 domain-containing protein [Methanorbis furvi]|uniref:DUF3566 domain-containing protein n=1 Tax=Methanorbis furvi TaxID=3028299 RepID=A0AAE4MBL3_9EURY|nr:hypothetical protein [Methanocorpusculaceae archaeon Ag1]
MHDDLYVEEDLQHERIFNKTEQQPPEQIKQLHPEELLMETREIRHVGVLSVAKFCAAICLIFSLISAVFSALFLYFGINVVDAYTTTLTLSNGIAALALTMLIIAVMGVIIGFISGAIAAFIYNIAAGVFGGIKIDLA